jgi:hypothetical protein
MAQVRQMERADFSKISAFFTRQESLKGWASPVSPSFQV